MFKAARPSRIHQNIVQQIRRAILAGDLKPGDRLPPEKELAENFGVSKSSLREGFRALEALGLLEVRPGMSGGAFVKEVDIETARNNMFNYIFFQNPAIHEFTQLRSLIEPKCAEMAAETASEKDILYLEDNLKKTEKVLHDGPFYYDLDSKFHHRIAEITGNRLICLVIGSLKTAIVNIKLELELGADFSDAVFEAHVRIFEAIKRRDAKTAGKEMLQHIRDVDRMMVAHCDADAPFVP